ncbi:MAG: ABC transporter substrate-binding protein [bacterium]
MLIKYSLIFLPLIIVVFLLQSYFWIPTYEDQVKGNPDRLTHYINGSIGDASILNPILNSDSASSEICSLIFEGLIDRDEDLKLRGRVAKKWEIYEEAYFYINKNKEWGRKGLASARDVKKRIENASLPYITRIEIIPEKTETTDSVVLNFPPRIKMTLTKVDQDLFHTLEDVLGEGYFTWDDAHIARRIKTEDKNDSLHKYLNTYMPVTEHNPIIVFHLRQGVRFSDGHECSADDVKFTYEAIMDMANRSPRISDYEPIKEVQVIDKYTVKIVYKRLFQPAINAWSMGILPKHLLNKNALKEEALNKGVDPNSFTMRESDFNKSRPIGVGPFTFAEWRSDQYIRLERNPDYWEGPPHYKEYFFRIIPDMLTQELEFYAGSIDQYSAQAHQVNRLKYDDRYQNFSGLSFGYTYIGYNARREPFSDKRIRKALTMAINIPQIITYLLYGEAEQLTGPFVKQSDYYNKEISPLPYDPDAALALLNEAGWEHDENGILKKDGIPFEFTLITNNGNPIREAILIIVQNAWKKLGIKVSADRVEWSVFLQKHVNVANFDALILGWSMGIDPDLYQIWHSSQTQNHQLNFVGYNNPLADDLIVKIRQEYNEKKQIEYCHRLHEIIYDDQPYTFLFVSQWTALLDKKIAILEKGVEGEEIIKKITPTKTGSYTFYFNKWIKFPEVPTFTAM